MTRDEQLIAGLPDEEAARRFLGRLDELHPNVAAKLRKDEPLLSDVLALAAFSPLLATTMLQNKEYIAWLGRKRTDSGVRSKAEMLESLARFALTNSTVEQAVMYARFRRRELLRIFLRDIRDLATIAELTEEISNLADSILESALEHARRDADNRFGTPQATDEKGRLSPANFVVVALGKLGSRELNYSSDIDLLFIYSAEGETTGGNRDKVTNREYFIKLSEIIIRLIGNTTGDHAAYRVDMRLRPHGTLGALAMSLGDTVKYYNNEARPWEQQVLIRSRASAGDADLYSQFYSSVEAKIYPKDEPVANALANVRQSKEKIDKERLMRSGYDVKLGTGGIREIEFIAQALQRAYGGRDRWLRIGHTLISLQRLVDRKFLSSTEITDLSAAYTFLRRTEHVLQMENGIQTHSIPEDEDKLALLASRMQFIDGNDFATSLEQHRESVSRVFSRIFGEIDDTGFDVVPTVDLVEPMVIDERIVYANPLMEKIAERSPFYAKQFSSDEDLADSLPAEDELTDEINYAAVMMLAVENEDDFGSRLRAMRKLWPKLNAAIVAADAIEAIAVTESKRRQTLLAEASLKAAIFTAEHELTRRLHPHKPKLDIAILALGKLGGRGLDFGSDLDLVISYFDPAAKIADLTPHEFYGRAVELFTNALSSMTRDGSLYRVDLRLRPYGSKGMTAVSIDAFLRYITEAAAIWELLAFVKLRFAGGDASIGETLEHEIRRSIHEKARTIPHEELRDETRKMRIALERRKPPRRSGDIDIKFGSGGMLDVYFAMRFLQLRDDIPDDTTNRSTPHMLKMLYDAGSMGKEEYRVLDDGHSFLSRLDHALRLAVGRTTKFPSDKPELAELVARSMKLKSSSELLEQLTMTRLSVREAFDDILS
ncbi:MAG TPA: hypothetical protein PKA82_03675 [Pyrinomonadaceae bacterium]|nr:hypothetical protein [Pyrinomonadaceae bacterium]